MKSLSYIEIDTPSFANFAGNAAGFSTGNYLTRGAGLTGAVDSKQMTFSAWIRVNSLLGARLIASVGTLGGSNGQSRVILSGAANRFQIIGVNSAGTIVLSIESSAIPFGDEWVHVIGSADLTDANKCHIYVNDVTDLQVVNTYTNDTIDYTWPDWGVGAYPNGSNPLDGDIAFLWFAPGVYIDLSVEANRRKFISSLRTPVDLGDDGSTPTGTAPLVYLAGSLGAWDVNKGTGGGFTTTGTLGTVDEEDQTWRFAVPTEYLPRDIEAVPSITGISYNPAVISLGENLGQRATLTTNLKDHRHVMNGEDFNTGTFWGKWRGRYGQRLRARAVRWIQGLEGDALEDMTTRHFIIESTNGPTPDGSYSITAQDVLKLADGDRALAPRPTDAFLLATIDDNDTAFSVGPTGAGDFYFPASGYINIGGKEVCSFTRVADAFTVVRNTTIPGFSYETEVVAHEAGERVQLCLVYTADDPADIIYDLFVNYASIAASYIDQATWQLETATYLQNVYTSLIAEPTAVNKLASELIQQAALAVWWDSLAATLRLQVLRAITTTAEDFTEQNTLAGTLKVQDQPNTRLSEVLTYFAQRNPLKPVDEKDNYRSALLTIDLDAQSDYGGVANKTIFSRWIAFGGRTVAERLNNQLLGRFVDPPRRFNFDVWSHGPETVTEGGGYELGWTTNQDELGNEVLAPIQVTRLNPMPDKFSIEAEEMLFTTLNEVDLQNRVITIDSDINNVNLLDLHDNLYAEVDPAESPTVSVTFIVSANVIVGSTNTANPSMDVGDWPVGFTPTLKIFGRVQGCGGRGGNTSINPDTREDGEDGGTALYSRHALNLYVSSGEIWGGGGGGAGQTEGNSPGSGDDQWGGGGGAGRIAGSGGTCSGVGNMFPGVAGTSEEGGLSGQGELFGLTPNEGGDPGQAGEGNSQADGGAAGNAIDGVSFITVVEGPGDILGPQIN